MVSRGRVHRPAELPGFVALRDQEPVGLLTYRREAPRWEVVSLEALHHGRGIGSLLLRALEAEARVEGAAGLWLITTNDNLRALRFYQRRGYRLRALHVGALDESRRLKPGIPALGEHGIPLRDEIELWRDFPQPGGGVEPRTPDAPSCNQEEACIPCV